MRNQRRGVIRLNDKTDHGGQVISAASRTTLMEKIASLQDVIAYYAKGKGKGKGKGNFAIEPNETVARHEGRSYAYDGDIAKYGGKLITSL